MDVSTRFRLKSRHQTPNPDTCDEWPRNTHMIALSPTDTPFEVQPVDGPYVGVILSIQLFAVPTLNSHSPQRVHLLFAEGK